MSTASHDHRRGAHRAGPPLSTTPDVASGVVPRRADESVPDITDYLVVHRAMSIDLDRLAVAAAELVDRPNTRQLRALRYYLRCVTHEIESHHHVEDEHVWPTLLAAGGERAALVELTEEHDRLDPLLRRAAALAARTHATAELASVLRETADLLALHIEHEERDIFPLLTEFVRVEDYARLQARFQSNLRLAMLPFVVPWAVRHATPEERTEMVGAAPWPLRLLLALSEPRFRRREAMLFR